MTDLPLDQVRTLLAAVDEGTFEAAARALAVTPSAVSQRIKELEKRTGRILLVRSKPVQPTESGVALIRFARQLAALEHDAAAELGLPGTNEPALVSIAVNADSLATWFVPALARVPRDPPVRFELHREDQEYTDELLRQGTVMAAVTASGLPLPGCTVRNLGRMRYRALATPQFVERWLSAGPLKQAVGAAPVVIFNRRDELQDRFVRRLGRQARCGPRHYVPASDAFLEAVEAGLGWGMIPDVQPAGREGRRLVEIAPGNPIDVRLYWQQWKLSPPALAAVGHAVAQVAAEVLSA
ncbi:MAG: LysR family transcriptional regulator ArgP [Actinocrinis sp.]